MDSAAKRQKRKFAQELNHWSNHVATFPQIQQETENSSGRLYG
jgi:hypothetical protein